MTFRLELPPIRVPGINQNLEVALEDWRVRLEAGVSAAFAVPEVLTFAESNATAAGSARSGWLTTASASLGAAVPAGHELAVLRVTGFVTPGATVGPYRVSLVLTELAVAGGAAAFERTLATASGLAASAGTAIEAVGTWDEPLLVVEAGKVVNVGWRNESTSPGALASATHLVQAECVIRPTS